ncbi:hypothetical protein R3P38DRAFT_2782425 [Favolaschia claudopus]|uniref:Uncharacterized protein n=1 Tax=Favolaschia claudopus TaxID=2862362 RepID=A0AAW0B5U2_9AGAR
MPAALSRLRCIRTVMTDGCFLPVGNICPASGCFSPPHLHRITCPPNSKHVVKTSPRSHAQDYMVNENGINLLSVSVLEGVHQMEAEKAKRAPDGRRKAQSHCHKMPKYVTMEIVSGESDGDDLSMTVLQL